MEDNIEIVKDVEMKRCAEDFVYFCENYVKINDPTIGMTNFTLYPYQKRYVEELQNNKFLITKKFRQAGFTTLNAIWGLWKCMFSKDNSIVFFSRSDRYAVETGYIVKRALDELPDWLKPKMEKNNDHQKLFSETNSKLFFYKPEHSRGMYLTHCFIDEAAFIPEMKKHWKCIYPTISKRSKCTVVSSPNGKENWFYKIYTQAEKLKNQFKIFHCTYLEHPDFLKEDWIATTKKNLGAKGWSQEFECIFLDPETKTNCLFEEKINKSLDFFEETMASEQFKPDNVDCYDERISFMKNSFDSEEWDVTKDNFYDDKLIWEDEIPNNKCKEINYKPEVYTFKKITLEQQKQIIRDSENGNHARVNHPEFEDLKLNSAKDMYEIWKNISEIYPEFEKITESYANECEEIQKHEIELENQINEQCNIFEMFLSGVISSSEYKELGKNVFARPDLKIFQKIKESKKYSKEMELSFSNGKLCVNKVATIIKEDDVIDLYNGTFSLMGYEQAINVSVEAIDSKLSPLFAEQKDEESLDK